MTPDNRYRDDLAYQLRKPRQPKVPDLPRCLTCGKLHCYKGHDGVLQPCGWCCSSPGHTVTGARGR